MNLLKITILLLAITLIGCKDATNEVFLNYEKHKKEINEANKHFSNIKPSDLYFYIRFNSEDNIDFKLDQKDYQNKGSWIKSPIFNEYGQYHKFDVNLNSTELKEALKLVNLNKEELKKLRQYLIRANCYSIGNYFSFEGDLKSAYVSIGYPTGDLYGLNYIIFDEPRSSSQIKNIVRSCNYKKINNKVLVEYGGPAFGSNCFPDK